MTRKVLGRGLSALLPESAKTASEELLEIDIDRIKPNAEQPRTRFTENALDELAQSIKANGVIQPIIVRRKGAGYEIVAGERRWRAAQRVGLDKVPAVVRNVSDEKLLELALIENIQREELNAIEEARAYKKLIETLGLTQENIANSVGKDRTFITNYLRLLKLPEDIQELVENEKISVGHARALLGLEDSTTQRRIARNIIEQSLTVRETERSVKSVTSTLKRNGSASDTNQKEKTDANWQAAEDKLRRRLGTKVKIVKEGKSGGGKIEIEFYDEADLTRIYQLLS